MRLRYLAVEEKDAVKTEKNELEQLKNELNQCVNTRCLAFERVTSRQVVVVVVAGCASFTRSRTASTQTRPESR